MVAGVATARGNAVVTLVRWRMASGTIYRRTTPAGSASWVVHTTWNEGGRRRQSKRSFRTKQEAKDELTRFLGAHQTGAFVAPSRMTLAEFVGPRLDGLANQGRRPSTLAGYRRDLSRFVLPRLGSMALQASGSPTSTRSTPTCCAMAAAAVAGSR